MWPAQDQRERAETTKAQLQEAEQNVSQALSHLKAAQVLMGSISTSRIATAVEMTEQTGKFLRNILSLKGE